jgi:hypothetical protein
MKNLIRKITIKLARNKHTWKLIDRTLLVFTRTLEQAHRLYSNSLPKPILSSEIKIIAPDLIVKYGPFKGMVYPKGDTTAYGISSKLLGSYESELHPIIERVINNEYSEIVDIGSAEGYYAVGFAMTTKAKVYAYDIDSSALKACREMADLNNVDVSTESLFTPDSFKTLPLTKALIFSDCEGYEKEIFTQDTLPYLLKHDILVEVHDFIDIEISSHLKSIFKDTHNLEVIESIDDIKRAQESDYPELRSFDLRMRSILLGEYGPSQMQWFYFTHK